jgi:hypothetical protein
VASFSAKLRRLLVLRTSLLWTACAGLECVASIVAPPIQGGTIERFVPREAELHFAGLRMSTPTKKAATLLDGTPTRSAERAMARPASPGSPRGMGSPGGSYAQSPRSSRSNRFVHPHPRASQ